MYLIKSQLNLMVREVTLQVTFYVYRKITGCYYLCVFITINYPLYL